MTHPSKAETDEAERRSEVKCLWTPGMPSGGSAFPGGVLREFTGYPLPTGGIKTVYLSLVYGLCTPRGLGITID